MPRRRRWAQVLGLTPLEAEAVLLAPLLVVGAHLAWLGPTESAETAGASARRASRR